MIKAKSSFFLCGVLLFSLCTYAQQRWSIDGNKGIVWKIDSKVPHSDHIEMAGKQIAVIFRYGVTAESSFILNKSIVWPMLRTIPNNTNASLMRRFNWSAEKLITVNGRTLSGEKVQNVCLDGFLTVESMYNDGLKLIREYFPSVDKPVLIENYCLVNTGKKEIYVEIPANTTTWNTPAHKGVDGSYQLLASINHATNKILQQGDSICFSASITGTKQNQLAENLNGQIEKHKRNAFLDFLNQHLVLETPDTIINQMFSFSKIRACESIYETKGGPFHGPGGEAYYAAIWANDQAEYINPYFPYIGYEYGNASALNSFQHFARFMNDQWKPIPSSIIAEGLDIWNGAGDRGDAAMIAYGAARYALTRGSRIEAQKLWPLIKWCLEYCHRKLNEDGVVASDSDELEGRFPSGGANLCTSSLYYDALISAAYLCRNIGVESKQASIYKKQAIELRASIEKYFGSTVEGFDTYAYYKGNDILRAWICIPLTVGIDERAKATIDALFSPRLWTKDGLLTQAGSTTFWDRSTLYALRGVFEVGETERAIKVLKDYSSTRLLGEHVPYAIEAWPEGAQRHLSAESALYGRIITEGMFGMRPTGLKSMTITPRLPKEWNQMFLRRIHAFESNFDIEVKRITNNKIEVKVITEKDVLKKVIKDGETMSVSFSNGV